MSPEQAAAFVAAIVAVAAGFITALKWMVHQFVMEIGNHLASRIDKLEATQELLVERQSAIYETLLAKEVRYGKTNKGTKSRAKKKQGTRR